MKPYCSLHILLGILPTSSREAAAASSASVGCGGSSVAFVRPPASRQKSRPEQDQLLAPAPAIIGRTSLLVPGSTGSTVGPSGMTRLSSSRAYDGTADASSNDAGADDAEESISSVNNVGGSSNLYADEECLDLCELEEEKADGVVEQRQAPSQSSSSAAATTMSTTTATTRKNPETARRNLELGWQVAAASEDDSCNLEDLVSCESTTLCETCQGTGRVVCRFCDGTGFLDIGLGLENKKSGDELYVHTVKGRVCPLCNEEGEEQCKACMGSGWVAKWRQLNLTGSGP